MLAGRYAEAADAYATAPAHVVPRAGRIAALALAGDVERASTLMARLLQEQPSFTSAWFADAEGLHPEVAAIFARGFDRAWPPLAGPRMVSVPG
jgi:hypothetical protein